MAQFSLMPVLPSIFLFTFFLAGVVRIRYGLFCTFDIIVGQMHRRKRERCTCSIHSWFSQSSFFLGFIVNTLFCGPTIGCRWGCQLLSREWWKKRCYQPKKSIYFFLQSHLRAKRRSINFSPLNMNIKPFISYEVAYESSWKGHISRERWPILPIRSLSLITVVSAETVASDVCQPTSWSTLLNYSITAQPWTGASTSIADTYMSTKMYLRYRVYLSVHFYNVIPNVWYEVC